MSDYGLGVLTKNWDGRKVWALLDTDDSGLPIWRQARVLCAVPPNRPSGGEWQFVLYTKHDDYRYILRAKPTEISPVKGMKFDCIHYDESIDIADHDFGKKVDVDLYDGNRASTHPFVAEELQALRTQLATASQKNDDMRMELEERRTSEARLRKELQDAKNQVQFLDQQLAISEAKNAPEVPRVTAAERQKYDSTIRALMDRTEQLSMENERNKNEVAELRARLANNPVREADYAQGYRARAEAAEAENAAMRRAMNDLQGMLNEADHNRGAGAAMRAKDDEIAQLRYALSAAQRINASSNANDSLLQAKDEEIARLKRSLHDQLARPAAADATTVKARDDEIARLRASINDLQDEMNGMQMRGGTEHELERLRGQVSETERQLYELRKYKADAEGLSDLRKTCESLQREVYELRIANNKLVGYKNDADRLPGVLAENSDLKRRLAGLGDAEKYKALYEKAEADNQKLRAQINELQRIINELMEWRDREEAKEAKLSSENASLKNELDALLYRDRDSREKALEAEIARLRAIINDLQSQLNDQYDHKRRGDYYYARCQALEEELRRSKGRVDTPNPGNMEFNIKGPQTTIFNQYLSMFQFSDTPEVTGPSMPAASMPTVGMRSVNIPSVAAPSAPSVGIPGLPQMAGTNLTTYNITMQPFGVTRLEAPATPGATKLVCQTPPDCKRGMHVVVGSGSTAEVGTIAGFGSLLLEKGVKNSHPIGTVVQIFPMGVTPPGFYIPSADEYSEIAVLRKRNAELEAELAALRKGGSNTTGTNIVNIIDGQSTDNDRLRLIINQLQGELNVEREKCEDLRYQNMRLRMRVMSLEDMLDARGVYYERPKDDYVYRDGSKYNLEMGAGAGAVVADDRVDRAEFDRLKKDNEGLLARYKMYRADNDKLTAENEALRKRLALPTQAPGAQPSSFSLWPFGSSDAAPAPVASTTLTTPVPAGSSKIDVPAPAGTEKGSVVVVGSGATAEKRTVTGFGSILLDRPLQNTHPAGTTLNVYAPGTEVPGFPSDAAATLPTAASAAMKQENAALQAQVTALQEENAALKRRLATAAPAVPGAATTTAASAEELTRLRGENEVLKRKLEMANNAMMPTRGQMFAAAEPPPAPPAAEETVFSSIFSGRLLGTPSPAAAATAKPEAVKAPVGPKPIASTTLDRPVPAGSAKIDIVAPPGTVKGSEVVIGSGATAEKRTVTGFGSILLDRPLQNTHPAGTTLDVYPPGTEVPGFAPAGAAGGGGGAGGASSAQVDALKAENAALKRRVFELQDDVSKAATPSYETQLRMEALAAEAAASKRRADLLATENDALKRGDTAGAAAAAAAAASAAPGATTASSAAAASPSDPRFAALQTENQKLRIDNKNLTETLARARSRIDEPASSAEAARLNALRADHAGEVQSMRDTMMIYEDGLNAARRENAALRDEVRALQKKVVDVSTRPPPPAGAGAAPPGAPGARPPGAAYDPELSKQLRVRMAALEIKLFTYEKAAGIRISPEAPPLPADAPPDHVILSIEARTEAVKLRLEALEDKRCVDLARTEYEAVLRRREEVAKGAPPTPAAAGGRPGAAPGAAGPSSVAGLQLQVDHLTAELAKRRTELKTSGTDDINACRTVVGTLEDEIITVIKENRALKKQLEERQAAEKKAEESSFMPSFFR